MTLNQQVTDLKERFKAHAAFLALFVLILWGMMVVGSLTPINNWLCIRPRSLFGLHGILTAPLLHKGVAHVAANSIPFFALSWMVLLSGEKRWLQVTAWVWLASGFGVWLIGSGPTLGISGVIFGYTGYLIGRGWYERKPLSILVAVGIAVLSRDGLLGLIFGNKDPEVSWSAHFFGLLGGVVLAWWMHKKKPDPATATAKQLQAEN